ncbi:NADH-quinone oxidoreductase subunit J [Pigmentiphaga sp.]|jgi:NADH:ubiquinone oxidoreductase subunit 6 (chain J)|uniref:NADH-quinone oxidoreductase subunit J n=1 Tax=Pigmentiphaga sp. TaxID=1977564 RepID=UPI0025F42129|nr:NADH-quinone oxidoreductase subunit J [Pigmentiphaga sp.]MBX6317411.1 NADH-quinone oxidoreductase subunit J [Pigmentiphaga sp.]
MTAILFYIFAAILVVAACRVIIARSPVTAVMHLVLSFFTASMIWMLLKAEFLAILLVLVYVGAVMVLFLFVVMMLDIDSAKLREGFRAHLPLGMIVGAIMVAEMAFVLASAYWDPSVAQAPADFNNTRAIGVAMYTEYIYAVEIAAVILLVGMVAAIALTLRRRTDVKVTRPSEQIRVRRQDRVRLVKIPSQSVSSQEGESAAASAPSDSKGSQL